MSDVPVYMVVNLKVTDADTVRSPSVWWPVSGPAGRRNWMSMRTNPVCDRTGSHRSNAFR